MIEGYRNKKFFVLKSFEMQGQNIQQGDILITGKEITPTSSGKQILICDSLIGDAAFLVLHESSITSLLNSETIITIDNEMITEMFEIYLRKVGN